ncbi:MAG: VOC family protein, partial [Myxococcales bacterium]|nr:VOC family protein [Myxococcales bacterium]
PGALCWNELFTTDVGAAGAFYTGTLGWETASFDMGPMGMYTLFSRAGEGKEGQVGGMMAMPPEMQGAPSNWLTYFAVVDVDASAATVSALGGTVVSPPADIPNIGRFAIVQDPQGATFALYKNMH